MAFSLRFLFDVRGSRGRAPNPSFDGIDVPLWMIVDGLGLATATGHAESPPAPGLISSAGVAVASITSPAQTSFTSLTVGDRIVAAGQTRTIDSIATDILLTVSVAFAPALGGVRYTILHDVAASRLTTTAAGAATGSGAATSQESIAAVGATVVGTNRVAALELDDTATGSVAQPPPGFQAIHSSGAVVIADGEMIDFTTMLVVGERLVASGQTRTIATILSGTALVTTAAFSPALPSETPYAVIHDITKAELDATASGVTTTASAPLSELEISAAGISQPPTAPGTIQSNVFATLVAGVGTQFTALAAGDRLVASGQIATISVHPSSDTACQLNAPGFSPTLSSPVPYAVFRDVSASLLADTAAGATVVGANSAAVAEADTTASGITTTASAPLSELDISAAGSASGTGTATSTESIAAAGATSVGTNAANPSLAATAAAGASVVGTNSAALADLDATASGITSTTGSVSGEEEDESTAAGTATGTGAAVSQLSTSAAGTVASSGSAAVEEEEDTAAGLATGAGAVSLSRLTLAASGAEAATGSAGTVQATGSATGTTTTTGGATSVLAASAAGAATATGAAQLEEEDERAAGSSSATGTVAFSRLTGSASGSTTEASTPLSTLAIAAAGLTTASGAASFSEVDLGATGAAAATGEALPTVIGSDLVAAGAAVGAGVVALSELATLAAAVSSGAGTAGSTLALDATGSSAGTGTAATVVAAVLASGTATSSGGVIVAQPVQVARRPHGVSRAAPGTRRPTLRATQPGRMARTGTVATRAAPDNHAVEALTAMRRVRTR